MELTNDEAYYWFVSRDLDWGFFDHPPMISLFTSIGVWLFGDTEIGVRIISLLMQPVYLYLLWLLVRPQKNIELRWKMAWTYCVMAFSVPMLQLYGFVSTPDAPLMMSIAFTLWCYRRFTSYEVQSQISWQDVLLLGLAMALMAYSKYHGALVVLCIVVSNPRLLLNPRFWISGVVAILLILPHLVWQLQHDWVSFRYHLVDRNSEFAWGNIFEFFLNVFAVFNPFLIVVFVGMFSKLWKTYRERTPIERALIVIAWGFLGFFLFSTKRGHVQPQWMIPVVYSMLYFVVRYSWTRPKIRKVLMRSSYVFMFLYLAFRIFIMSYHEPGIRAEIFDNQGRYGYIDSVLDGRKMVMSGNYWGGAKVNFYSQDKTVCYSRPSIYGRDSHWSMLDYDREWYGARVAQQLSPQIQDSLKRGAMPVAAHYIPIDISGGGAVYYDTVNFYIPTQNVTIESAWMPDKVLINQQLAIDLIINNPYPYDIPLGGDNFGLYIQFGQGRFFRRNVALPLTHVVLPANSVSRVTTTVKVPNLETGEYNVAFILMRPRFDSWYNSSRFKMRIVNPRTRV